MIKTLAVTGLNDRFSCALEFQPDLNILTGKNGSGKTTLLKLIWYLISGNLERIFPEMTFEKVEIRTTSFALTIDARQTPKGRRFAFEWAIGSETGAKDLSIDAVDESNFVQQLNRKIAPISGASVFFPTFRRIEGGFSTRSLQHRRDAPRMLGTTGALQAAMAALSDEISVYDHRFVASISTHDVVELLTKKYAESSERTNSLHVGLSEFITERIRDYSVQARMTESQDLDDANSVLQDIEQRVSDVSEQREGLLKPFSVLSQLTSQIFQHKAIRLSKGITLGDARDAISSDKLSAGEKQMLSFLCYNAFYTESSIFIDEPELSLHVDWQRLLFPTLLQQETRNQFIVATHSPFIFSKYPDKELVLDLDRGGE
jgi:predicted ATPase